MSDLDFHPKGHELSGADILQSIVRSPYSFRHEIIAKYCPPASKNYHKRMALIGKIPIISILITFFERILGALSHRIYGPSQPRSLQNRVKILSFQTQRGQKQANELLEDPIGRMVHNARIAITEHYNETKAAKVDADCVATSDEVEKSEADPKLTPLNFTTDDHTDIGLRETNEDAHFSIDRTHCQLHAVFDGHGGSNYIAKFAKERFEAEFINHLQLFSGFNDIATGFKTFIDTIQNEIKEKVDALNKQIKTLEDQRRNVPIKNKEKREALQQKLLQLDAHMKELLSGSTAVICYVDKRTNLVYTATLGDAAAVVFRKISGTMKAISLSPIRDWTSAADKERAEKRQADAVKNKNKPGEANRKLFRVEGSNVSRSLGDVNNEFISQDAEITVRPLLPDDVLVLGCDGLYDYTEPAQLQKIVSDQTAGSAGLAHRLVEASISEQKRRKEAAAAEKRKESGDNVSVIAIRCREKGV